MYLLYRKDSVITVTKEQLHNLRRTIDVDENRLIFVG